MKGGSFLVSIQLLREIFNLPDDAVLLAIMIDKVSNGVRISIASDELPEVKEGDFLGDLIPIIHVELCEHGGILKKWIEWKPR